jgi:hypothetical protein
MLRRVALVRTDASGMLSSSETSILTRATRHNIPEDTILHSQGRENLKSYTNTRISNNLQLKHVTNKLNM